MVLAALAALAGVTTSCSGGSSTSSSSVPRTSTLAGTAAGSTSNGVRAGSTSTTSPLPTGGSTTTSTTTVTSTSTTTSTGTGTGTGAGAAAGPSPCATTDLTGSVGVQRGTAGETIAEFVLRNDGGKTCTLDGYANVSLFRKVNGIETPLAFTTARYELTGAAPLGVAPVPIRLAPAAKAAFYVVFYQVQSGTAACDHADGIEYQAPSSAVWKQIGYRVYACGPEVQLSALQAA